MGERRLAPVLVEQQHLLARTAYAVLQREGRGEPRDGRVEERHPRLERVGHARPVGLHEQVVHQVDAEIQVLQPRQLRGALGLRVAGAIGIDRV